MKQNLNTNQVPPTGFWVVLLAATAGGILLFTTMFSMRLEGDLLCPLSAACLPGTLFGISLDGLSAQFALPISVITWGLILIPTAFAAWYFRRSTGLFQALLAALVLFTGVLVLRGMNTTGNLVQAVEGTNLGIVLIGQAILIGALGWTLSLKGAQASTAAPESAIDGISGRFRRLSLFAFVIVSLTLVSGALLSMQPAADGCVVWPVCNLLGYDPATPDFLHVAHWAVVGSTAIVVGLLAIVAWRQYPGSNEILVPATALMVLFYAQVLIGGLVGLKVGDQQALDGLHSLASTVVWCLAIFLTIRAFSAPTLAKSTPYMSNGPAVRKKSDYLLLTKPIIVILLLVTTYTGMVVAGGRLPSLSLTFWTLFAGALAAGGSSAINQYIDRERDRLMTRTAGRPIAAGRISPAKGLAFGVALCLTSFFLMAAFVNLLAAILSLIGIIYYVYFYSILLKDATVQNIVIGGGAGAIPPLVGWAAVTGNLTVAALMLFVVIFMWTPPHFWALALVRRKDYARAGVPMLPVVRGETETRRQIFIYTIILVLITLTLPLFELGGAVYFIGAGLLGIWLIYTAWKVLRIGGNKVAWKMYRYSSMYLAFLFLVLVVDVLLG